MTKFRVSKHNKNDAGLPNYVIGGDIGAWLTSKHISGDVNYVVGHLEKNSWIDVLISADGKFGSTKSLYTVTKEVK